jgi:hypothetical protein
MTKLGEYLKRERLSHRAFAVRAGFPHLHPMVGLWARGKRIPGLDTAFAIERATGGKVPAAYWSARKQIVSRPARRSGRPSRRLPQNSS